jgi:lambda repressor-like predicted transcriptional regulator
MTRRRPARILSAFDARLQAAAGKRDLNLKEVALAAGVPYATLKKRRALPWTMSMDELDRIARAVGRRPRSLWPTNGGGPDSD